MQEYMSYNGLARRPMFWGVPYMKGLFVVCFFVLIGLGLSMTISPAGWFFALLALPVLIFFKVICVNDDRGIEIFMLENKWRIIKAFGGNAPFYEGLLTIGPITYGRRANYVKRYFTQTARG
jgi:type IV secretion system protein VirB3